VTSCSTAPEARKWLSSEAFDVVLADQAAVHNAAQQPQAAAPAAAAEAGERLDLVELSRQLPCVLMGDDPSATDVMAGIQAGAVDFLSKPLCTLKLRNIWQHTVRKVRAARPSPGVGGGGEAAGGTDQQLAASSCSARAHPRVSRACCGVVAACRPLAPVPCCPCPHPPPGAITSLLPTHLTHTRPHTDCR